SGYVDMSIGIAGLLGFSSPINFNNPYGAQNIQDFWRRWHISFSEWLRDYVYIPLDGSRVGSFRYGFNTLVTMFVSGLWHGVGLNYIVWGLMHGSALISHRIFMYLLPKRPPTRVGTIIASIITFNFVAFCWIFFATDTPDEALTILKSLS